MKVEYELQQINTFCSRKWKPYGSRRRKNIGRVRGLKRNIPTTPVKIIGLSKNRQKAGDSEYL